MLTIKLQSLIWSSLMACLQRACCYNFSELFVMTYLCQA
uniref:Uncharacterized protein n=1 Tax=Setaria viridis TaxID=4556 RepID=A0A4V6D1K0_SETVI|nr:hypothetical protein SEVIR_9G331350v2 [Setaria viridis]